MNIQEVQKIILANKIAKGFNVTDIPLEFAYLYSEVGEAFEAWRKKKDDLGEELADVTIYILGLAQILGIDLEEEITHKMEKIPNVFMNIMMVGVGEGVANSCNHKIGSIMAGYF